MKEKKEDKKEVEGFELKKNFFAYFLLFFPTLIIAAIPETNIIGGFTTLTLKLLLIFYQFIVIKNFVDRYYGV